MKTKVIETIVSISGTGYYTYSTLHPDGEPNTDVCVHQLNGNLHKIKMFEKKENKLELVKVMYLPIETEILITFGEVIEVED